MDIKISYQPSYSMASVRLGPNEAIRTEAGAMVAMSPGITLETKMQGGLLKSLARSILGGESLFINNYQAGADGGVMNLAPVLPGDMFVLNLNNESMILQSGAFVASESGTELDTKWGGAKTFFSSEGLIMLKAAGTGSLIVSSYGAIHEMNLDAGQKLTVDTGHLVAFTEGIGYDVRTIGGIKSTLFSGEGLVVDLTGPGRALLQTRSQDAFLAWLIPRLPASDGSGGSGVNVRLGG
ncbi:MAG: TIGR00266 family protein [Chloroflexi bacterium]|nr:TIGR00266 family protein [Chloroflexota bacterium]